MKISSRIQILLLLTVFILACNERRPEKPDEVNWADSVAEKAVRMMDGPDPSSSVTFLDSAFASAPSSGNRELWRKYNTKVNYYEHYLKDPLRRRLYIDSMLLVSSVDKDKFHYEYVHSLYEMALFLQEQQRYNEAFKYYYDGRTFARGKLDNCGMSEFSNALGIIRYKQGRYSQAIPFLSQAYKESMACESSLFQYSFIQTQSILNSIALCFEKSGQGDSAVHYYEKALVFIRSQKNKFPEKRDFMAVAAAVVEGNLGGTYAKLGNYAEAEKHLITNIQINDRPGFAIEDAQTAKLKLVDIYIRQGRLVDAADVLGQLETDLKTGRGKSSYHSEIWNSWYLLKSRLYEKQGDIKLAFSYSKRYGVHNDSLENSRQKLGDIDVDQLLTEQDQRHKMSLLQKSSELKTTYVMGLSIFLIMAISIAAISWLYYRRSRQNVSELTEANYKMQQVLTALENSQRDNTRLMKIVAHDLRSPIAAIASVSELMLREDDRNETDLQIFKMIKDTSFNSLELVNNLMHLNASGPNILKTESVNLAELLQQCVDMLRVKAMEKQQQIHLSVIPASAKLSYEKIWRVVSNLISNAIKFSPVGLPIHVSLNKNEREVMITVRDEGIGVPAEVGNNIFDVFSNAKRPGTAGEESFGFGLSISKQIVEAHGGTITFTSTEGAGTTFYISLPLNA